MHEVNISRPLSLAWFFLTQEQIYGSKTKNHNVSLGIPVSDTSIFRNLNPPGLEKNYFSYIKTHTHFFESDSGITRNHRTFMDQS